MQTSQESKSIFEVDKKVTFVLLCIATFLVLYIKKSFIENETAAFEFLQDRPEGGVLQLLNTIQFFSIPLIYLWKFTVIGFVIWVGCFLYGYRITFSQCWGIAIVAEYIFLVPELIKITWFLFVDRDPTLPQIHAFYPFSLMNLFDYQLVEKRYLYPLKALNIFEIIYWAALVAGIDFYVGRQKKIPWIIVLSSYVLIFILWLAFYCIVYK